GGHEQLHTEGATELGDLPVQAPPRLGDDVPDEGIAVGVNARGRQADEDVAGAQLLGAEQVGGVDDTRGGPGDIVFVDVEQSRVLGALPADQGDTGAGAGIGDAADDIGDAFCHDLAACDVVGHEQRP